MGQLLFLFHKNDSDKCIEYRQLAWSAVDTTIIKCEQNGNPFFDSDIHQMSKCFIGKKLTVNVAKCEAMFSGSKQPLDVFLMGKPGTYQKFCKYFGIQLHSGLRFKEHIGKCC